MMLRIRTGSTTRQLKNVRCANTKQRWASVGRVVVKFSGDRQSVARHLGSSTFGSGPIGEVFSEKYPSSQQSSTQQLNTTLGI